jgi:DNA-binding XRE family transcriptional regulator
MHLDEFLDLLANEIVVRREKLGLTQAQAAKKLDMTMEDLIIFEKGEGIPDLLDWLKMCEEYDFEFTFPVWTKANAKSSKRFKDQVVEQHLKSLEQDSHDDESGLDDSPIKKFRDNQVFTYRMAAVSQANKPAKPKKKAKSKKAPVSKKSVKTKKAKRK